MERVPLMYQGRPIGDLRAKTEGEDTCFFAVCRLPEKGLWCLWAVGSGGELRLGVPEGENGAEARLNRRFSRRMTAPLGRLRCGELRRAAATEEKRKWEETAQPETLFRTPWLRRALSGVRGARTCRMGKLLALALPFSQEKPFPLVPLFCFACVRSIGGSDYAVFAFDENEWPVVP